MITILDFLKDSKIKKVTGLKFDKTGTYVATTHCEDGKRVVVKVPSEEPARYLSELARERGYSFKIKEELRTRKYFRRIEMRAELLKKKRIFVH